MSYAYVASVDAAAARVAIGERHRCQRQQRQPAPTSSDVSAAGAAAGAISATKHTSYPMQTDSV